MEANKNAGRISLLIYSAALRWISFEQNANEPTGTQTPLGAAAPPRRSFGRSTRKMTSANETLSSTFQCVTMCLVKMANERRQAMLSVCPRTC